MSTLLQPEKPLPHSDEFAYTEEYVSSLLSFVGGDELLRTLCGGVHILDFFTTTPSLYSRVLPEEWRTFLADIDIMDLLDLLMREDLTIFAAKAVGSSAIPIEGNVPASEWRGYPLPPHSFVDYIRTIRRHLLDREPRTSQCSRNRAVKSVQKKLARHVAVGMNVKKVHEVGIFASYIDGLTTDISRATESDISHLVDFGSGQNYLGRALASEPYNRNIVAIESKQSNTEKAKLLDISAKLAVKEKPMVDKKVFRAANPRQPRRLKATGPVQVPKQEAPLKEIPGSSGVALVDSPAPVVTTDQTEAAIGPSKIQYIEHRILDGDLAGVIAQMPEPDAPRNLMIISLHSCGNLVHHGLRSMSLNPEVKAVAMVGCCYNLLTERLGPATYKLPELRPTTHAHPRLEQMGEACDPHGFPMSSRFCDYVYQTGEAAPEETKGVRLNITARMMAVQAPTNWGTRDSREFFRHHYYRALLQRVFLDFGVVGPPRPASVGSVGPAGHSSGGTPIIIGSLRKPCYETFVTYFHGAMAKLVKDPARGDIFREKLGDVTDEQIQKYDDDYACRKKELSTIWSLMAFSAGVIEATIVVDRWLWLKEQDCVAEAWVEPVFDYSISPRNLVVVGVRK